MLQSDNLPLADKPHKVHSGYWKEICNKNDVVDLIMEQEEERGTDECELVVPLSEIEIRSGLTLFSGLTLNDLQKTTIGYYPSSSFVRPQIWRIRP